MNKQIKVGEYKDGRDIIIDEDDLKCPGVVPYLINLLSSGVTEETRKHIKLLLTKLGKGSQTGSCDKGGGCQTGSEECCGNDCKSGCDDEEPKERYRSPITGDWV